jgi:hypothetical protein
MRFSVQMGNTECFATFAFILHYAKFFLAMFTAGHSKEVVELSGRRRFEQGQGQIKFKNP